MINYFRIAKIVSLHGIKGDLKCISTTFDNDRFNLLKKIYVIDESEYELLEKNNIDYQKEISDIKFLNNAIVFKIKGVDSVEDAKKYIGREIYINREEALPLKTDEYYIPDLILCDVYDTKMIHIGKVVDVDINNKDDILVVRKDKKDIFIPMVKAFIKSINIAEKKIIVELIEGML